MPEYGVTFVCGLTNDLRLKKWHQKKNCSNVFSNNEEAGKE